MTDDAGRAARDSRHRRLLADLAGLKSAVLAFSGGLDSSFLLHAACQAMGEGLTAVTLDTPYAPRAELAEAAELARSLGARHVVLPVPFPEVLRNNPPERCYLCKKALFAKLLELATNQGIAHVLDGANLDDLDDYRPGMRALAELGIVSPLLAAGIGKADIRALSRQAGLPTWNKPSGACLLTRLPHGTRVAAEDLTRIDATETWLRSLGFPAVRLRSHGDLARLEVPRDQAPAVLEADARHGIDAKLKALGYRHVTLDLAGYRMGSLNEKPDATSAPSPSGDACAKP
ncbi:MAG: TIGR00268 family protein [Solidesulfovibrio magneticus str. Maddingley MBC34]|uniref:TIGR00268 family protein n=1 Tax=Solidesulfovibrio magneticus str. Maddingley MBC34 TaxID=1206767 RepID=K6HET2_9BACT|nr:MAG: TIGR00268 family protein [Solidesulfovibrio magneticus str. Maddingley MBC34]